MECADRDVLDTVLEDTFPNATTSELLPSFRHFGQTVWASELTEELAAAALDSFEDIYPLRSSRRNLDFEIGFGGGSPLLDPPEPLIAFIESIGPRSLMLHVHLDSPTIVELGEWAEISAKRTYVPLATPVWSGKTSSSAPFRIGFLAAKRGGLNLNLASDEPTAEAFADAIGIKLARV